MSDRVGVEGFFDPGTSTVSYVVWDRATKRAAIIDPVLDYDSRSGHTSHRSLDRLRAFTAANGLAVDWILETHAHADHLSGARPLQASVGGRIAIGARITEVQRTFAKLYNLDAGFATDGSQFDRLLEEGEALPLGESTLTALHVPGHTPADLAYLIDDAVFVGDTMFMPDVGSARADFPGGDARQLYRSIRRLLALPAATRIYVCHDYPPASREARWQTTVAEQRAANLHVRDGVSEDEFYSLRTTRDAKLDVPALLLPSIQVNIRAGQLPPAEANGVSYLRIPVDYLPIHR